MQDLTRREFVRATTLGLALGAAGCGWSPARADGDADAGAAENPYYGYAETPPVEGGPAGGYGSTTSADIEGPFYRAEAPLRQQLAAVEEPGKRLTVSGRIVRGLECVPLAGAVLDVWQATADGHYDNDDPRRPPSGFRLRGKVRTDKQGRFEFHTIWPGNYKIGAKRWRPAHLHFKASAEGCQTLTSQLYFEGDEHNEGDPWFDSSRLLRPKREDGVYSASYEIVLEAS